MNTLVYFDLEATGLKSAGRPRITEISLVAINVRDILDCHERIKDKIQNPNIKVKMCQIETILPRVTNKMALCVYPMALIMPEVSKLTGLDNYNLTGQTKFDKKTVDLISCFLAHLPSPVCLVAHNGNLFDFPLLKAEMEKVGKNFEIGLWCVDSYVGIKEIFKKREETLDTKDATEKSNMFKQENGESREMHPDKLTGHRTPTSFSVVNLHQHFLGSPPTKSHGAG